MTEEGHTTYQSIDGVLYSVDGTKLVWYPSGRLGSTYTIAEGVTSIGNNAFYASVNLRSIQLPASVRKIGNNAFAYMPGLTQAFVPSSVTSIGTLAFALNYNDSGNNILTIYGSAGSEAEAYANEVGIAFVQYSGSGTGQGGSSGSGSGSGSGVDPVQPTESFTYIELSDGTIEILTYEGDLTVVNVPSVIDGKTVSCMASAVFAGNTSVRTVTLPETIKEVYAYSFKSCSGLRKVVLPAGLEKLGDYVFQNCNRLTEVVLPESLKTLGAGAFYECSSLTWSFLRPLQVWGEKRFIIAVALQKSVWKEA